jgi:hypothetical protein
VCVDRARLLLAAAGSSRAVVPGRARQARHAAGHVAEEPGVAQRALGGFSEAAAARKGAGRARHRHGGACWAVVVQRAQIPVRLAGRAGLRRPAHAVVPGAAGSRWRRGTRLIAELAGRAGRAVGCRLQAPRLAEGPGRAWLWRGRAGRAIESGRALASDGPCEPGADGAVVASGAVAGGTSEARVVAELAGRAWRARIQGLQARLGAKCARGAGKLRGILG